MAALTTDDTFYRVGQFVWLFISRVGRLRRPQNHRTDIFSEVRGIPEYLQGKASYVPPYWPSLRIRPLWKVPSQGKSALGNFQLIAVVNLVGLRAALPS